MKKFLTTLTTASFAFMPLLSVVDVYAESETKANSQTTTDIEILESEINAETDTTIEVNANTGAEQPGNRSEGENGHNPDGAQNSDEVRANSETSVEVESSGSHIFIRSEILAGGEEYSEVSVSSVESEESLELYAKSVLLSDEGAEKVEVTSDEVSLTYDEQVKLFWFIPLTVNATATVDAEGNVTVDYPWYVFLSSKNSDRITTSIESDVSAIVESNAGEAEGEAAASAKLSARAKAAILAAIHEAMQSNISASTEADAEASAEASA